MPVALFMYLFCETHWHHYILSLTELFCQHCQLFRHFLSSFLQLRAAVHKLCQREPAAVLRASCVQARAGGVQPGEHQLAAH